MLGSHKLYAAKQILHRDISIFNLAYYTDETGRVIGVLIDFDLASAPPFDFERTSNHRTGTVPFMALDVLDISAGTICVHGLHHDLESYFYVIMWHGLGYRGASRPKTNSDPLEGWRKGSWQQVMNSKMAFFANAKAAENMFGSMTKRLQVRCKRFYEAIYWTDVENRLATRQAMANRRSTMTVEEEEKAVEEGKTNRLGPVPIKHITFRQVMEEWLLTSDPCSLSCCNF